MGEDTRAIRMTVARRQVLKLLAVAGGSGFVCSVLQGCGGGMSSGATPTPPAACSKLTDIEHVVLSRGRILKSTSLAMRSNAGGDFGFQVDTGTFGSLQPSIAFERNEKFAGHSRVDVGGVVQVDRITNRSVDARRREMELKLRAEAIVRYEDAGLFYLVIATFDTLAIIAKNALNSA